MIKRLDIDGVNFLPERSIEYLLLPEESGGESFPEDERIFTREIIIERMGTGMVMAADMPEVKEAILKWEQVAGMQRSPRTEDLMGRTATKVVNILKSVGLDEKDADIFEAQKLEDLARAAIGESDPEYRRELIEREVIAGRAIRHGDNIILYREVRRIPYKNRQVVVVQERTETGRDCVLVPGFFSECVHKTDRPSVPEGRVSERTKYDERTASNRAKTFAEYLIDRNPPFLRQIEGFANPPREIADSEDGVKEYRLNIVTQYIMDGHLHSGRQPRDHIDIEPISRFSKDRARIEEHIRTLGFRGNISFWSPD